MKEQYTSPEAKLLCFVPAERVANTLDFNDFFNVTLGGYGPASSVIEDDGDVRFPTKT